MTPVAPYSQPQTLQEVNDIVQFMQIANSLGPQDQMALPIPRITAFIADKMNNKQDLLTTPEEQEMMMQQMQAQAMAEQGPPTADDGGATMEAMQ